MPRNMVSIPTAKSARSRRLPSFGACQRGSGGGVRLYGIHAWVFQRGAGRVASARARRTGRVQGSQAADGVRGGALSPAGP